MNIRLAEEFAREKHKNQYRKQGTAYIEHPIGVMELLKTKGYREEDYLIAALFHDLLEDTDASREEILKLSNPRVLRAVELLTKDPNYKMDEYIFNIGGNEMARVIKLADRTYNLKDARNSKDEKFIDDYIVETEKYYVDLSKSTVFEEDIEFNLRLLKNHLDKVRQGY